VNDRDLIAELRRLHALATADPWRIDPHSHMQRDCRCLSCHDDATVWHTTNMLDCDDVPVPDGGDQERCDQVGYSLADAELITRMRNNLPALLDALEAAQRPALRCQATTVDPTDAVGHCLWCELPDGHAGKHHAERPQWVPTGVEGFMTAEPLLVDWPDAEASEVREVQP
jgi:hypothetical protein